jgi:hypothetical protein
MVTAGIRANGPRFIYDCYVLVRDYNEFNKNGDEHDFGSFMLEGKSVLWKIDYYDKTLDGGSENPADPEITCRVLTVMLAEEY